MVSTTSAEFSRAAVGLVSAALNDRDVMASAVDIESLIESYDSYERMILLAAVSTLAASMLEEAASLQGITPRERVQQLALDLERKIDVPTEQDEV